MFKIKMSTLHCEKIKSNKKNVGMNKILNINVVINQTYLNKFDRNRIITKLSHIAVKGIQIQTAHT